MATNVHLNKLKSYTNDTGDKLAFFIVESLHLYGASQETSFKKESFSSTAFMEEFTKAAKDDKLNVNIKENIIHIKNAHTPLKGEI